MDILLCGACYKCVAAVACYCCLIILWMSSFLHDFHLFFLFCELLTSWSISGQCRSLYFHGKIPRTIPVSPYSLLPVRQRLHYTISFYKKQRFYINFCFFTVCTSSLLFLVCTNIFRIFSTASSDFIPFNARRII